MDPEIEIKSSKCEELTWSVYPLTESFKRFFLVITITLIFCWIVYISLNDYILVAVLMILVFLISLSPVLFPTRFTLNNNEIKVKRILETKRSWSRFRGFYWDNNGVQLTTFTHSSRLDAYRGLFLKFSDNKDEVLDFIKEHLTPVNNEKPVNSPQEGE